MRILLLEDDVRQCRAYARRLRADGYHVQEVGTLAATHASLRASRFDCLVLDRLVPDGDSMDLLVEVDALPMRPRLLIISAVGEGDDRANALELGADDYMVKPVHLEEMALRVRNLLRNMPSRSRAIELGRVVIHRDLRDVTLDGTVIYLTRTQYDVLEQLALRAEQLVTKDYLIERCWSGPTPPKGNPLHSQISRLRSIFDGALVFEAIYGAGYAVRVAD